VDTDILNTLVTEAIWRAEELEGLGIHPASAWKEVSKLEEQLAKAFPVSEAQGRIARRGAVDAALKGGDYDRAQALADAYMTDEAALPSLKAALHEILDEADQAIANRFQHAAKYHTPREARDVARRVRTAGPFGLAA
jgi:hypothetical protein